MRARPDSDRQSITVISRARIGPLTCRKPGQAARPTTFASQSRIKLRLPARRPGVAVRLTGPQVPPGFARLPIKVLILAANPPDTEALRIDREISEIQKTIRSGKDRDNIEVSIHLAVGPADISQALLDHEPRLVHFAGHGGGPSGSIAVENDYGLAHIMPVDGVDHLFRTFGSSVHCVLVNACDTEKLAWELSAVVPYAIGMRQSVRDMSSIRFSAGFYQTLAAGKSIEEAFQLGVIMLMMTPVGSDALSPMLFRRD